MAPSSRPAPRATPSSLLRFGPLGALLLLAACPGPARPPAPAAYPPASETVLTGEVPPRGAWAPFAVPGCGVTIDAPAAPAALPLDDTRPTALGARTSVHILQVIGAGGGFLASCVALPSTGAPVDPQAVLEQALQELLQRPSGEPIDRASIPSEPVALGGHPGLALRYPHPVSEAMSGYARIYVVGDRLTMIQVAGLTGPRLQTFAEQLLGSARLTEP